MDPSARPSRRIAFFTFPVQGHVTPALPVVAALTAAGHHVSALTTAPYEPALLAAGASVVRYPEALAAPLTCPSDNFVAVAAMLARATEAGLLDQAIVHLQNARADVVIVDSMAPWGRVAAEFLGIPAVTSTASFLIDARLAASTPRAAADAARQTAGGLRALAEIGRRARAVRSRYGMVLGGPARLLSNRAQATVAYTSRALQPGGERFDASVHFVGPPAAERDEASRAVPPELARLLDAPPRRPLTYVSLGTIYHDRPAFLRRCIEALARPDRDLVVSVGRGADVAPLRSAAADTVVCVMPPQLRILDRADLFVTHGGLGSVHEALWRGVPMVVFPQAADQPVVAARVEALGAARVLRDREPSVARIASAASSVRHSDAAGRASALGAGLRAAGGAEAAAAVVLSAVARSGSSRQRSRLGS